ncbi:MAG: hypothetical protein RSD75_01605, partial [Mucinivorans sp.]
NQFLARQCSHTVCMLRLTTKKLAQNFTRFENSEKTKIQMSELLNQFLARQCSHTVCMLRLTNRLSAFVKIK